MDEQERKHALRRTRKIIEVAQILGMGKNKVYELVHSGKLRAKFIGRNILIPLEAIEEFLNARDHDER